MIPKRPALAALTSLRFFAALAIVIHHCNGVFWTAADLGPLDAGVSFFFVLSGFILTYMYHDTVAEKFDWRRFYTARFARIWPLHVVCLILTIAFVTVPEPFDGGVLVANSLMLHAWIPFDRYFFSYNYASWSISTELFFYLLFPFVLQSSATWRYALLTFSLATVMAFVLWGATAHLPVWDTAGNHLSSTGMLYTNPLARFAEFLLGVIGGRFFLQSRSDRPSSSIWTLIELLGVGVFVLAFRYFLRGGMTLSGSFGPIDAQAIVLLSEWLSHVGLAPFAAIVIYVFAHQRGLVSQLLTHRALVFFGEISFALYLVHQITLRTLQQHAFRTDLVGFGCFLSIITVLAVLLHVGIEKPARAWLTRRASLPAGGEHLQQ